jgi:hypothetical protein
MNPRRYSVVVPTDGAGNGSVASPMISGEIIAVHYVKDGTNAYSNGVTTNLTLEATGQVVWNEAAVNASAIRAPRQPTHSQVGAAALYAAGGTAVLESIVMAEDRVVCAISGGGANKTGTFIILVR